MALVARATLADRVEFVAMTDDLHSDETIANDLSTQLVNKLTAEKLIPAEWAAGAVPLLSTLIVDPEFSTTWRKALGRAHDQALGSGDPASATLDEAFPGLAQQIEAFGGAPASATGKSSVKLVADGYVEELRAIIRLLNLAVLVLPAAAIAVTYLALRRTRRTLQIATSIMAATAAMAALAAVLLPGIADAAVSASIGDASRPFADAGLVGMLPAVRTILFGIAAAGGLLGLAGRVEQVRTAPVIQFAPRHTRARRSIAV